MTGWVGYFFQENFIFFSPKLGNFLAVHINIKNSLKNKYI